MIKYCKICDKDKEFIKPSKGKYPQARCEKCEKLFALDFMPNKNYSKIPGQWLCEKCKCDII